METVEGDLFHAEALAVAQHLLLDHAVIDHVTGTHGDESLALPLAQGRRHVAAADKRVLWQPESPHRFKGPVLILRREQHVPRGEVLRVREV